MKRFLITVVVFIGIFRSLVYAENSAKDINVILDNLEKKMSGVSSIQTDFIQEKKMVVFDKKIVLKGKVFIKDPDLFSWHTNEPVRYVMVIKGDIIRQWDEDSRQVQTLNLSRNPAFSIAVNQMKIWFEGRYSKLLSDYEAKVISIKPVILEFIPKKNASAVNIIKKVRLSFREDERYIERIDIEEKNQDSSTLTFLNTKLNTPIDPSSWELK